MKNLLFITLTLCCTIAAQGQNYKLKKAEALSKPKVAVYVTSDDEGSLDGFVGDYMVDAIVRSDKYTAVERTTDFLKQLSKVHEYQRSGSVDDNQIAKLGKQFGEQLVCVVKVGNLGEGKYLSSRVVDVETATVMKSSKPFPFSMEDLPDVCENVITQLFGSTMARTFGKPKSIY